MNDTMTEYAIEDFNPDCFVTSGEAMRWAGFLIGNAERLAREWLATKRSDIALRMITTCHLYCHVKAMAMDARLLGRMALAQQLEETLDQLYLFIPEELRW